MARGLCKKCYDRDYHQRNHDKVNAKKRAWAKANPERIRVARRKYLYGVSEEQYIARLNAQDGLCKICLEAPATDVDHNASTGDIRGILCGSCNRAIGLLRERPAVLRRAADYLELFEAFNASRVT